MAARTLTALVEAPSALVEPTSSEPAWMSMPPLKELPPVRVRTPPPIFLSELEPAMLAETRTPLVALTSRAEAERVPMPELMTLPPYTWMILATELPKRSSTPALTTTLPTPRPPAFLATSVPSLRTTPPTKVFAPERTSVPAPVFVSWPRPEITPENSMEPPATATPVADLRSKPVEMTCVPAVAVTVASPTSDFSARDPPVPVARVNPPPEVLKVKPLRLGAAPSSDTTADAPVSRLVLSKVAVSTPA